MTAHELADLPPVLDLPAAAALLGIGRTLAYQLVQRGQWPTPVLRLGNAIRIPTAPLLAALGLGAEPTGVNAALDPAASAGDTAPDETERRPA